MYIETLETLSHVAGRIAEGGYSLRSNILTEDEVGALSRSFDRMADTVEEKISRLEKTNKNQQLLIGALTHELKTPMTAIIGFSDSLLTMPLSEEEKAEALEQINRVVLGYMSLQMKDNPERSQLVPVWDFFGSHTIDQEFYDFTNFSLFTINALDGTVIDRDLGY